MIRDALDSIVANSEMMGAVTILWQDGDVLDVSCVGWQDTVGGRPMRRDTLFRIASMTKPITTTAALMLYEEGLFELDDPVTAWLPELADLQVIEVTGGLVGRPRPRETRHHGCRSAQPACGDHLRRVPDRAVRQGLRGGPGPTDRRCVHP